ncbi:MAG: two-component sensor histidine kinase, partial [Pseudonocardia sp.]|nr:two-component sensor histidine kinase [Pseudonocardia sp.]
MTRPRGSLAMRVTAACLVVAAVATGVAGLVSLRLVGVTARDVTQEVLADQADVVAAQLAEAGPAIGARQVVDVLRGQGVSIVRITDRGLVTADPVAREAARRTGADRTLTGQPVSATARVADATVVVEARSTSSGGFALVRRVDVAGASAGLLRRTVGPALLAGGLAAVAVGLVLGRVLARPLRRPAAGAPAMATG